MGKDGKSMLPWEGAEQLLKEVAEFNAKLNKLPRVKIGDEIVGELLEDGVVVDIDTAENLIKKGYDKDGSMQENISYKEFMQNDSLSVAIKHGEDFDIYPIEEVYPKKEFDKMIQGENNNDNK